MKLSFFYKTLFALLLIINTIHAQDSIVKYKLTNLDLNNEHSNFGTSFFGDNQIVYSTSKNGSNLNLYVADIKDINNHSLFSKSIKSNTHDSNVTFTNDRKTMYFTRTIKGKKKNRKSTIGIFKATLDIINDKWIDVTPMPFNNKNYIVAHPTLNKENNILYFTSNMPGSYGDNDIFEVEIKKDGTYSLPRNLGSKINTKGKEMFPFIADDNFLYFSSDGQKNNFGGLDLYYAKINGNSISDVVHLKDPINSKWDDFSYIFNSKKKFGFLSSNRSGGKGSDDIYFVNEIKNKEVEKPCFQSFMGTVIHGKDEKNVISDAIIEIKDHNENLIKKIETRSNAKYKFNLECNTFYIISISRDGYVTSTKYIETTDTNNNKTRKNISLIPQKYEKVYKIASGNITFNFNDSKLLEFDEYQLKKAVRLMDQNQNLKVIIESYTDSRGDDDVNMELTKKRVLVVSEFFIKNGIKDSRIIQNAYGETKLFNRCKNNVDCTTREHLQNRKTSFLLTE